MEVDASSNIAAVLYGPETLKIESWPVEEPHEGEIQAKIQSVGVCGTDFHYWKSGTLFGTPLPKPMVLGHETSAIVVKVGSGVTKFKPGDKVHLIPAPSCHKCATCYEGKAHNCQAIKLGLHGHGHLRRICNHPEEFTVKIPDNLSLDEGALMEPWAVGVYSVERSGITVGQNCAIIGSGAVGILVFLAAKLAGAANVCIVDIDEAKLKSAQKMGECVTVLAGSDPKETAQRIEEKLGGKPDVAFDASCSQIGITTAIYTAKPCGKVVLAGLAPDCTLPMRHAAINEIDIINVVRFGSCYPRAIEILKTGKVDLKSMIAMRKPLEKTDEAFQEMIKGLKSGFKIIIDCTM